MTATAAAPAAATSTPRRRGRCGGGGDWTRDSNVSDIFIPPAAPPRCRRPGEGTCRGPRRFQGLSRVHLRTTGVWRSLRRGSRAPLASGNGQDGRACVLFGVRTHAEPGRRVLRGLRLTAPASLRRMRPPEPGRQPLLRVVWTTAGGGPERPCGAGGDLGRTRGGAALPHRHVLRPGRFHRPVGRAGPGGHAAGHPGLPGALPGRHHRSRRVGGAVPRRRHPGLLRLPRCPRGRRGRRGARRAGDHAGDGTAGGRARRAAPRGAGRPAHRARRGRRDGRSHGRAVRRGRARDRGDAQHRRPASDAGPAGRRGDRGQHRRAGQGLLRARVARHARAEGRGPSDRGAARAWGRPRRAAAWT